MNPVQDNDIFAIIQYEALQAKVAELGLELFADHKVGVYKLKDTDGAIVSEIYQNLEELEPFLAGYLSCKKRSVNAGTTE